MGHFASICFSVRKKQWRNPEGCGYIRPAVKNNSNTEPFLRCAIQLDNLHFPTPLCLYKKYVAHDLVCLNKACLALLGHCGFKISMKTFLTLKLSFMWGIECDPWCRSNLKIYEEIRQDIQWAHLDGLVQERRNSSALAMELRLPCTNPSIWYYGLCWNFHIKPRKSFFKCVNDCPLSCSPGIYNTNLDKICNNYT